MLFCSFCHFILYTSSLLPCTLAYMFLGTFDKTSDIASCGTVPRNFVQDTVVCWLVATTVCSCGFRKIDIVWHGPVFLVPGLLRHPIREGLMGVLKVLDLVQSAVLFSDGFTDFPDI